MSQIPVPKGNRHVLCVNTDLTTALRDAKTLLEEFRGVVETALAGQGNSVHNLIVTTFEVEYSTFEGLWKELRNRYGDECVSDMTVYAKVAAQK